MYALLTLASREFKECSAWQQQLLARMSHKGLLVQSCPQQSVVNRANLISLAYKGAMVQDFPHEQATMLMYGTPFSEKGCDMALLYRQKKGSSTAVQCWTVGQLDTEEAFD